MDNDKVDQALGECALAIRKHCTEFFPQWGWLKLERWGDKGNATSNHSRLKHALWMIHEALDWPASQIEKKFRWLGFVQGILWADGVISIEEAKRQNMFADAPFNDSPRNISEMMDVDLIEYVRKARNWLQKKLDDEYGDCGASGEAIENAVILIDALLEALVERFE